MREKSETEVRRDNPWEDLVISILSVNNYSMEKTYSAVESLRAVGLVDPSQLVTWDIDEISAKLRAAQCDRGPFLTPLFADRLAALGQFLRAAGVVHCERIILSNDVVAITELLMPVRGIGPKVLSNLFLLRGIVRPKE